MKDVLIGIAVFAVAAAAIVVCGTINGQPTGDPLPYTITVLSSSGDPVAQRVVLSCGEPAVTYNRDYGRINDPNGSPSWESEMKIPPGWFYIVTPMHPGANEICITEN